MHVVELRGKDSKEGEGVGTYSEAVLSISIQSSDVHKWSGRWLHIRIHGDVVARSNSFHVVAEHGDVTRSIPIEADVFKTVAAYAQVRYRRWS